jgi:hypothetical protein
MTIRPGEQSTGLGHGFLHSIVVARLMPLGRETGFS